MLDGLTISGGTASICGAVAGGQTVTFAGSCGDLALAEPAGFAAFIAGFGKGDESIWRFRLSRHAVSFTEAAGNHSGTLTVSNGASTATLTLVGSYATSNFTLATELLRGELVTYPPEAAGAQPGPGQGLCPLDPHRGPALGTHYWGPGRSARQRLAFVTRQCRR